MSHSVYSSVIDVSAASQIQVKHSLALRSLHKKQEGRSASNLPSCHAIQELVITDDATDAARAANTMPFDRGRGKEGPGAGEGKRGVCVSGAANQCCRSECMRREMVREKMKKKKKQYHTLELMNYNVTHTWEELRQNFSFPSLLHSHVA